MDTGGLMSLAVDRASLPPWSIAVHNQGILLEEPDFRKLSGILAAMKARRKPLEPHLRRLDNELRKAIVVESAEAVTIGSRASLVDMDTAERKDLRLVFPADLGSGTETVSILSPLGVALIGELPGALIHCDTPTGVKRFSLLSVTRPGTAIP